MTPEPPYFLQKVLFDPTLLIKLYAFHFSNVTLFIAGPVGWWQCVPIPVRVPQTIFTCQSSSMYTKASQWRLSSSPNPGVAGTIPCSRLCVYTKFHCFSLSTLRSHLPSPSLCVWMDFVTVLLVFLLLWSDLVTLTPALASHFFLLKRRTIRYKWFSSFLKPIFSLSSEVDLLLRLQFFFSVKETLFFPHVNYAHNYLTKFVHVFWFRPLFQKTHLLAPAWGATLKLQDERLCNSCKFTFPHICSRSVLPYQCCNLTRFPGRLYQVEYAMEAIGHAGTCLGILANDGVLLAAERRNIHKLLDEVFFSEKIYKLNE